jgi:hypothetical protein
VFDQQCKQASIHRLASTTSELKLRAGGKRKNEEKNVGKRKTSSASKLR